MSDLTAEEKEELTIEIEKILTIKGVNTYATDLIPLIETFYKNRALLANGINENSEQALSIADVINCPECGHDKQEPSEHGYDWFCLHCGLHF